MNKTKEVKHTQGKWEISDCPNGYPIIGTKETDIAQIFQAENDRAMEANARLIASAPELLEACKCIKNFSDIAFEDSAGYKACLKECIDKAKQAIFKAEGK